MLSFIGIAVGLVLFVALAYRGFNLVLSAIISSCRTFANPPPPPNTD